MPVYHTITTDKKLLPCQSVYQYYYNNYYMTATLSQNGILQYLIFSTAVIQFQ